MGNTSYEHADNTEQHKRLGEVHIHSHTDHEGNIDEYMTIKRVLESEKEFNKWRKQISRIEDSMTRQVIMLPTQTIYESEGVCGSTGIATITFEHFPYVFQTEINNRRRIHRFFLQTELWYLLYNLVRAGSKFAKYNLKIGDVHPANILINNDGLVKVISTCSLPQEITNFDKLVDNPHATVFLAPQELAHHSVEMAQYPKYIDPSTAECYSIGLVMLAAGTLEDVNSVYTIEQGQRKLLRHKVNYYLKLFGERYSSYLHSTVMGLLVENPPERKKCSQIYAALSQYEEKILNLDSFMPNHSRFTPFPQTAVRSVASPQKVVHVEPVHYSSGVLSNPIESTYIRTYPHPGQIESRNSQVIYRQNPHLHPNYRLTR